MKKYFTLLKTELKLSLRSPDSILFGIIMPVVILFVIGFIYMNEPDMDGGNMIEMTFGAFLCIGICATAFMGLPLVLADYREKKVLKRFQVTPVHPGMLLSVQFGVQAIMASLSAVLVSLAAVLVFSYRASAAWIKILAVYLIVLTSLFAVGLMVAATAKNIKQAGFICSILYFPMLLFSGTTIPFPVFPEIIKKIAFFLPLRQGIILVNGIARGGRISDFLLQIVILTVICILALIFSVKKFRWEFE